ncbi:MAG TPA: hypothetical protein QGF02_03010 [Candidatus Babeliales bacterium]|nr:hypothetical protein [Candidatus Babeliales bacterium]
MKKFFIIMFLFGQSAYADFTEHGLVSSSEAEHSPDQRFEDHGFASTGDNPFVPTRGADISKVLVRSHLQDLHEEEQKADIADAVIERLKKERLMSAAHKGQGKKSIDGPSAHTMPVSFDSTFEENLETVFNDPALNAKKISINTPAMEVKKVIEMIGQLAGISFFIDQDVTGKIGSLHVKNKTAGELLQLITSNHKPRLAVIKKGKDVWRITLYSEALAKIKDDNANKIVTKTLPIKHARITEKFKNKINSAWKSFSGETKDPTKFMYIDDDEKKVLVRGHPVAVQELYKFLFEVDKPIIQVRIDAILVLAQKSFDFAFGIDWSGIYNRQQTMEKGNGVGFWGAGARMTDYPTPTSSTVDNNANLLVNPNNFAVNLFSSLNALVSDKADIRRIADFIKIPFVFGGPDLNLKRLNLVLNAAETHSKLKIISRPSVLTSNNELAKLLIGQSIPLQTAIEDVTTANTRNITTINFKDTGIILEVKPTVSSSGKSVTLDIFIEDSQVTSGDTKTNENGIMENPPTISVIKAKNNVILRSGQTTIIGGLSGNRNQTASNEIPYLNRLPIFGKILFKSDFNYNETTERFIFITPTIIEQEMDMD